MDVICTDKTGTLTENKMTVKKIFVAGNHAASCKKLSKETFNHFRNSALLCNEAKDTEKGLVGDAEDIALIDFFNAEGVDIFKIRDKYPAKSFEPFSSEKKFARSRHIIQGRDIVYLKGAPEIILSRCTHALRKGKIITLDKKKEEEFNQVLDQFGKEALRTMAFCYEAGKRTILIGLIGIHDPPKQDITTVVNLIYEAGISLR